MFCSLAVNFYSKSMVVPSVKVKKAFLIASNRNKSVLRTVLKAQWVAVRLKPVL